MPTISDVAKRAGVSTYTVSAVLNRSAKVSPELTRRVLEAVTELDYTINYIARSLQTRKTETIGMLLPDIGNSTYASVLRGVEDICKEHNYSLLLGSTHDRQEDQSRGLNVYRAKQVDGVLLFVCGDESGVVSLMQKKIPVVCVGRRPLTFDTDYVISDHRLAASLATRHLISRGHRKIAIMTGSAAVSVSRDSIGGWSSALREAGLEADPAHIAEVGANVDGALSETVRLLGSGNAPAAIVAANIAIASRVLRAARERNVKVPDQLEITISSDSEWLDAFEPRISAVVHANYEMGSVAAQLLFRRMAEPERPFEHVVLQPSLKIR